MTARGKNVPGDHRVARTPPVAGRAVPRRAAPPLIAPSLKRAHERAWVVTMLHGCMKYDQLRSDRCEPSGARARSTPQALLFLPPRAPGGFSAFWAYFSTLFGPRTCRRIAGARAGLGGLARAKTTPATSHSGPCKLTAPVLAGRRASSRTKPVWLAEARPEIRPPTRLGSAALPLGWS